MELGASHRPPADTTGEAVNEDDFRLATFYEDVPGQRTDEAMGADPKKQEDEEKDKDKKCPLIIRLLVPPCWFLDK